MSSAPRARGAPKGVRPSRALGLGLLLTALLPATPHAATTRSYTLSVEVGYGEQPSRQAYLDEIQRKLVTWARAGSALDAPIEPGKTDLHLRVTIDEIERSRGYPGVSGERDVFADTGTSATSPYVYRSRLEVRAALLDPRREAPVLFEDRFTVYAEAQETQLDRDPRQRSWDDCLEFLVERVQRFLARRDRKIRAYLQAHPAPAP